MTDTSHGTEFEREFAKRNGLDLVPGSGSQWHSKLDEYGRGARWSLKSTKFGSFQLSRGLFEELAEATEGAGGTGELQMVAIELGAGKDPFVVVCMSEDDFRQISSEKIQLLRESKAEAKRRAASVPQLLRDDGAFED